MALMLVVALMLIVNTVRSRRSAAGARPGSCGWWARPSFYIQMPFIVEAAVAGLLGARGRLWFWWSASTSSSTTGWRCQKLERDQLHRLGRRVDEASAGPRRSGLLMPALRRVLRVAQVPEGVTLRHETPYGQLAVRRSRVPLDSPPCRAVTCSSAPPYSPRGRADVGLRERARHRCGDRVAAAGAGRRAAQRLGAPHPPQPAAGHSEDVARAAEEAAADGKSPLEAAERAVSRSGDRWAAVYSQGEYQEFEEYLDGRYTGVGLEARRARGGRIEITKVQPGSPAAAAGIRAGDRLRTVDGRSVDGLPVTDVVALLRGDAEDASAGTPVRLGLERAARAWTETVRRAVLSKDSVTVRELADRVTVVTVAAFTKGVGSAGARRRAPCADRRPDRCSTCAATPAAWSPRP